MIPWRWHRWEGQWRRWDGEAAGYVWHEPLSVQRRGWRWAVWRTGDLSLAGGAAPTRREAIRQAEAAWRGVL